MATKKKKAKNKMTKKQLENVDLRKVPKDKRPKPSTGQSAPARTLAWDELNADERAIVKALNSPGHGERRERTVEWLSELFDTDNPKLTARNAIRRLIPSDWLEKTKRAVYQISKNGRARYERAHSK